jgi:glycosyltransferase involved in cell wall biosynthesis
VIANAHAVKEYVARCYGIAPRKIRVIHNGVSVERVDRAAAHVGAQSVRSLGPADAKTVAMVASLTRKKDHGTFLAAASMVSARAPGTRFLAVGDGPLRAALVETANDLGMDGPAVFVGESSDTAGILAGVDVSVLTSVKEGCSNVILESMAAGRPVVVTDVGGNAELVEDGVTGYVVPAGDPEAVARRILDLLGDDDLREAMGRAGRQRVVEEFAVGLMVEKTVEFYLELLRERVPRLFERAGASDGLGGARDAGARGPNAHTLGEEGGAA